MGSQFIIAICEEGELIYLKNLAYTNLEEAKAKALKLVDDALPNNTVYVLKKVGMAYLAGDGSEEWKDFR